MITPNQFKNGITIVLGETLYTILWFQHVKPGKGGGFVRTKIKCLKDGSVHERTFKSEESIKEAFLEDRQLQYQYHSADIYHFMDTETYEDWILPKQVLGDSVDFLKENIQITGYLYDDKIIDIKLPFFIELMVTHTEPGIKGDTARQALKPATLETGAVVQVPLFINAGDTIKIDTRTYKYAGRA